MPLTPAFTDYQQVVSAGALTSASFTPSAGDVLVVKTGTWSTGTSPGTPTDTSGQVWTQRKVEAGGSFNGQVQIWTAVVGEGGAPSTPGAITVSITPAASCHHCLLVEHWPDAKLAATPATGSAFTNGSAAPSTTLTSTEDGSAVSWVCYDNNSTSIATRAYLSSAIEEAVTTSPGVGSGNGIFYHAYQDAGTAGTETFGLSAPATMRYNIAGIEILAAGTPPNEGAIDGSLPTLGGSLTADVSTTGMLQGSLPALGGSLTAELGVSGVLSGVLPGLGGSLAADVVTSGLLAGVLPALSGSLVGTVKTEGLITGVLPVLGGSLSGDVYILEALLSGVLPTLSGNLTGEAATLATIGGALPTLGGSLTDFVESVGPDAIELLVNRINTRAFIRADPVSIVLRTRTLARTPSGAYKAVAVPEARSRQIFKLIMQSPAGGSIEQRTEDGTERQVDYILLGEWDAEIEVGDYWDDEAGQRWEVVALVPRNGYETRAVVEAHGKDLTGG